MAATTQAAKRHSVDQGYGRTSRQYETPDGNRYDSVTSILSAVGKPALINWAANEERKLCIEAAANLWEDVPTAPKMSRPSYVATLIERIGKQKAHQKLLAKAGEIGSQVHALIEWTLRKELGQEPGPAPHLEGKALWAYQSYEKWRASVKMTPLAIEQTVWSHTHRYAGTMDLFADLLIEPYGSVHAVLDWKSGKGIYPEALLQNAAYVAAMIEMGHAKPPVYGVIVRFPKVEDDPDFEVKVIPADAQAGLLETFRNVKALWDWSQAQDAARKAGAA